MRKISSFLVKPLYQFRSKKIVSMKPEKVQLEAEVVKHADSVPYSLESKQVSIQNKISKERKIPRDWQTLQFDKLCSLSGEVLADLQLQIKKYKMNANDSLFQSSKQVGDPEKQLTPYWVHIYKTFCNLKPIDEQKLQKINKEAYLAKIHLGEPEKDEKLIEVISKFVNNIHDVKKLEAIAEPTFCKYLLSLKRDLKMQGLNLQSFTPQLPLNIQIVKILSYEYQFWVDVKHNRQKNGTQSDFVVMKKTVDNPNKNLLILQDSPKIQITYITRKKKRKQIEMNFAIKMQVETLVEGKVHVVKVETKGPSSSSQQKELRNQYLVIDYDGIFGGNPTVRPIFKF